jgi:hypothetical protein
MPDRNPTLGFCRPNWNLLNRQASDSTSGSGGGTVPLQGLGLANHSYINVLKCLVFIWKF